MPALLQPKLKGVIQLAPGAKVQVVGLQGSKELNGLVGQLLQFDAAKMRWGVELESGKKVLLKIGNLVPLNAEVSEATVDKETGAPKPLEVEILKPDVSGGYASASHQAAAEVPAEQDGNVGSVAEDEESWPVLPTSAETAKKMQSGCWFDGGSAARRFTKQLCENDPTLVSVVLVPPKRFNDEDAEEICQALHSNGFCKELIASGHHLSLESCKRVASVMRKTQSLALLSIGDSSLGDDASILFEALAENSSLTSLDLEQKGLTAAACRSLAGALQTRGQNGRPQLASLKLSNNRSIGGGIAILAEKAPAPLQLGLCDCALGTSHAKSLGLWVVKGVEDLDLRDNSGLGGEGIEVFLGVCTSELPLRRLNLSGCAIGDEGLEAVAEACSRKLQNLEELLFERCEVSAEGCELLARVVSSRRLRKLSARANVIGDKGCAVLAECARCLDLSATSLGGEVLSNLGGQPLESLELFSNPALGPSVATWCAELKTDQWQDLEYLDLSGCCLKDAGFSCLCSRLKDTPALMPSLSFLCLGANDIAEDEAMASLVEKLQESRDGRLRVVWQNS